MEREQAGERNTPHGRRQPGHGDRRNRAEVCGQQHRARGEKGRRECLLQENVHQRGLRPVPGQRLPQDGNTRRARLRQG